MVIMRSAHNYMTEDGSQGSNELRYLNLTFWSKDLKEQVWPWGSLVLGGLPAIEDRTSARVSNGRLPVLNKFHCTLWFGELCCPLEINCCIVDLGCPYHFHIDNPSRQCTVCSNYGKLRPIINRQPKLTGFQATFQSRKLATADPKWTVFYLQTFHQQFPRFILLQ